MIFRQDIVYQKESNYHFIQYKDDGHHCVTRSINSDLRNLLTSN